MADLPCKALFSTFILDPETGENVNSRYKATPHVGASVSGNGTASEQSIGEGKEMVMLMQPRESVYLHSRTATGGTRDPVLSVMHIDNAWDELSARPYLRNGSITAAQGKDRTMSGVTYIATATTPTFSAHSKHRADRETFRKQFPGSEKQSAYSTDRHVDPCDVLQIIACSQHAALGATGDCVGQADADIDMTHLTSLLSAGHRYAVPDMRVFNASEGGPGGTYLGYRLSSPADASGANSR